MIKVCGLRDPENIRAVAELGVDLLGFIFWPKSSRYVSQLPSHAGIIPDKAGDDVTSALTGNCKRVGVFVDDMPQNIVTRVYNYHLDYVQLHGSETAVYIDNLKRTLVPDIVPDIKIIKALSIREADDVKRWREYKGYADMLLFDTKCDCVGGSGRKFNWEWLNEYDGDIPFLLSGGIGEDDAETLKTFSHPMLAGIDLNSKFEDSPAMKNIEKLRHFISEMKK